MSTIDWSLVKFRASSIHKLMTEPKSKEAKEKGELSETTKTYLKEVYIDTIWGLSRDLQNKFCDKGKMVEEDMITMLSRMDKRLYLKNEERIEDDWFSGIPDIIAGENLRKAEYLIDGKSSWSPWTFIAKMGEKLDPEWESQVKVYLHLCNCPAGEVSVCLLSTPDVLIMDEQRKAAYAMNALTTESPEYLKVAEEIEKNSRFDHIPMEQRRLRFPVQSDPEFIEKAKAKIEKSRIYLKDLHEKHMAQYPKSLTVIA